MLLFCMRQRESVRNLTLNPKTPDGDYSLFVLHMSLKRAQFNSSASPYSSSNIKQAYRKGEAGLETILELKQLKKFLQGIEYLP